MKLLNLCCGSVRPQSEEWINVDNLHETLLPGTPERGNLDKETNYINQDLILNGGLYLTEPVDGILASHCFEHFDCQTAVQIMQSCHFYLKPGGVLLVSVPDVSYFRKVHAEDTVENAERLFGEPIHLPDGETTFFGYGLWNRWHKAILSEDALWCYFRRAGFRKIGCVQISTKSLIDPAWFASSGTETNFTFPQNMLPMTSGQESALQAMRPKLNRLPFSLVMCGVKE